LGDIVKTHGLQLFQHRLTGVFNLVWGGDFGHLADTADNPAIAVLHTPLGGLF